MFEFECHPGFAFGTSACVGLKIFYCFLTHSFPESSNFESAIYARIWIDATWTEADVIARATTFKGVNGSLLSIFSPQEQSFVQG